MHTRRASFGPIGRKQSSLAIKTAYVWRKKREAYNTKTTVSIVKHSVGSVMLWGCIIASGTGNLVKAEGIVITEGYVKILKDNLKLSSAKLGLDRHFFFQYDNNPKHTLLLISYEGA